MEFTKIQRERAVDAVYQAMRQAIVTCVIKPGERLNVEELAEKFGVSLTPVRGAIQQLARVRSAVGHSAFGFKRLANIKRRFAACNWLSWKRFQQVCNAVDNFVTQPPELRSIDLQRILMTRDKAFNLSPQGPWRRIRHRQQSFIFRPSCRRH